MFDLFPSKYLDQLDSAIGQGGWAILQVVILAPVLEEILFRGLILGSIRQKSGKALGAVFISAAIFGAMHVHIPQKMVNALVIGLILGYIYVKTESLAAVIIIHAINNGLAYVLRELFGSSANAVSTKEMIGNDTVYYIIYGICLVMLVVSFVMMIRAMARGQAVPEGEITGETAVSGVGNGKSQENEKTSAPENNNKV